MRFVDLICFGWGGEGEGRMEGRRGDSAHSAILFTTEPEIYIDLCNGGRGGGRLRG